MLCFYPTYRQRSCAGCLRRRRRQRTTCNCTLGKKRQGSRSPRPTKPVKEPSPSKAGQKEDKKQTKLAKSPKKSKAPKAHVARKSSESPATRKSSGTSEPIPQIEVTFDNDLDPDPVYDNAVAVGDQVYTGG